MGRDMGSNRVMDSNKWAPSERLALPNIGPAGGGRVMEFLDSQRFSGAGLLSEG